MHSNSQSPFTRPDNLARWLVLLVAIGQAASANPPPRSESGDPAAAGEIKIDPVAVDSDVPLQVLDGQFKLQAGDIKGGAAAYVRAALLSDDPQLAEQATQLALVAADWNAAERSTNHWHELAPTALGVEQARGWLALGRGNSEAAFKAFSGLIAKPGSKGWPMLGQALLVAPDKAKAAELLSRLATPERLGNDELTWVAMSQLAFKLDDKFRAQDLSDQAVVKFHGVESTGWNAQLALDRGDAMMARDIYGEGLRLNPDSPRLRVAYAALLAQFGDEAAAAQALSAGRQDDLTYAARMAYAVRADDKPTLAVIYREVLDDKATRTPARRVLLGQLGELNGDYAKAADWYRKIPVEDQRWFDAQSRLSVTLDEAGKIDDALEIARRLQSETGLDNEAVGKGYLLEADLFKKHGRDGEARAVYDRALSYLPHDTRLLYSRALLAAASGDVKVAEADLRNVIEQEPENAAALNALGYTLADRTPRLNEALALIEKAYAISPDEPSIIDSMGWVQFRLGRQEEAVATLKRAYDKFPDPEVASHYAEALWATGRRDMANMVLADAMRATPDNALLLDARKRLKP